ncbi:MAG TPA: AMP-binding protein [Steroidobacteraceae bacterium]|nr:AMP-binding protein [Steroidobacteraceae bacterium]
MQLTSAGPAAVPFRETDFLPVDLAVERRTDGAIVLRSRIPLREFEPCLPRVLAVQAARLGNKPYLVQRRGPQRAWTPHSYAATKRDTDAIAQWLLNRKIARDRPILLLSGNSIAHALVKFGGMAVGVPACPVSANYGLMDSNFARLRHVVQLTRPGVVFVEQAKPFARALEQVDFGDAIVLTATPEDAPRGAESLDDVLATPVTSAVAERIAALRGDDHAAYMLTSGSTGPPKAVVQTYANITANIAQALQTIGSAAGWHATTMDWLPWNHVSGAFGKMNTLVAGGTLYIDDGKPIPGPLWQESLRNLREITASYYVNVPLGYQLLVEALEADEDLRRTFFRDLRVLLYGGAGLPQPIYERLQRLAVATIGKRIMLISAYGSTETTSGCLAIHFETDKVGLGVPMPGVSVKLVPVDERYEVRIAGPVVTPCYLRDSQRTAESRDEEGYYRMGDLAVFHDPQRPEQGLAFAGRLAEEFKLGSGTWVCGGQLRAELLRRLAPLVDELVLCGEGHTNVGVLAWPNRAALESGGVAGLQSAIRERLAAHNAANPGASTAVRRVLLLQEPPNAGAQELSDKGTVNRSAVLLRRKADVERLYAESADVVKVD